MWEWRNHESHTARESPPAWACNTPRCWVLPECKFVLFILINDNKMAIRIVSVRCCIFWISLKVLILKQKEQGFHLLILISLFQIAVTKNHKVYTWGNNPACLRVQAQLQRRARLTQQGEGGKKEAENGKTNGESKEENSPDHKVENSSGVTGEIPELQSPDKEELRKGVNGAITESGSQEGLSEGGEAEAELDDGEDTIATLPEDEEETEGSGGAKSFIISPEPSPEKASEDRIGNGGDREQSGEAGNSDSTNNSQSSNSPQEDTSEASSNSSSNSNGSECYTFLLGCVDMPRSLYLSFYFFLSFLSPSTYFEKFMLQ